MSDDVDLGAMKLHFQREKERYSTLLKRSEVLDERAGTLLSSLVIVSGIAGAFWAFALDGDGAKIVNDLMADGAIVASLFLGVVLYGLSAVSLGASLLMGVRIPDHAVEPLPDSEADALESGRDEYSSLADELANLNDCKWRLLFAALGLFALAFACLATFASRVVLQIGD